MQDEGKQLRIAGYAGIVFSVLSLIVLPAVVPVGPPALGGEGSAFVRWFAAHGRGFLWGNYLGIVAFVPGFVQLAILGARVKRKDDPHGFLGSLVLSTGTFAYSVFACSLVVFQVLPFLAQPRLEGGMEVMGSLAQVWFALDGLVAVPLVLAVAWAALGVKDVLPRAFGYASVAVALLLLFGSFGSMTTTPTWLGAGGALTGLAFVALFGWTFALAVISLRQARSAKR